MVPTDSKGRRHSANIPRRVSITVEEEEEEHPWIQEAAGVFHRSLSAQNVLLTPRRGHFADSGSPVVPPPMVGPHYDEHVLHSAKTVEPSVEPITQVS
eukprot:845039-Prorocentrum_minimum.AAC.1